MRVVRSVPISAPWPDRLDPGPSVWDDAGAGTSGPLAETVAQPWAAWLKRLPVPDAVTRNFQRVREGAAVVVTGQQPVILGGPLMVILKAARAVSLARALEEKWGRPVVPVFWIAGDDHDLGEMLGTAVLDAGGALHRHRLQVPDTRTAANALLVPEEAGALLAAVAEQAGLPDADRFQPQPGDSLSTWFARTLLAHLGTAGLVPLDPQCLDAAARPLFEEVLERGTDYQQALRDGALELEQAVAEAPLPADADPPVFVIQDGERHRLRRDGDGRLTHRGSPVTIGEVLDGAQNGRWRLSANVSLRVLLQNRVLPVAAFVAGPAERLYQAQLRPLHEAFAVAHPAVVARPSATVLPRAARRHLRRLGLEPVEWFAEVPPEEDAGEWSQRGRELHEQVRRWLDEPDEKLRPGGRAQERVVNPLSFLQEYGDALVSACLDLPADQEGHWLIMTEDQNHD